jgi:hypothetical protein
MHLRARPIFRLILGALAAVTVSLACGAPARAGEVTYTFTGVGNGTLDGTAWSGDFTFVFTANTSNITSGGVPPEFFQRNIGGTVSEGSFSATLNSDNTLADNNDPSFPRFGFFNSTFDNGGTIQNAAFATYQLATAIGPITGTGSNLLPTLNTDDHGFDTVDGHNFELLGITSLTVTASVPEPSSLVLAAIGLAAGCGLFLRRRKAS